MPENERFAIVYSLLKECFHDIFVTCICFNQYELGRRQVESVGWTTYCVHERATQGCRRNKNAKSVVP